MMSELSSDIRIEARDWVVRMADADVGAEDHGAFRAWYDSDQTHADAYEAELDVYYALADLESRFADEPREEAPASSWRVARAGGLAMAASVALVFFSIHLGKDDWGAPVETGRGEVRTVKLPDGSVVALAPKSKLQTGFTADERRVRLVSGQAYFTVVHNAARPFVVDAQGIDVLDIGTEFEIRTDRSDVRVTVAEGVVDVTEPLRANNAFSSNRVHRLTVGRQILVTPKLLAVDTITTSANVQPGAWRDGLLVYENATLEEVVSDANRYVATPIQIANPQLGGLRVTAAYRPEQIEGMLSVLAATMPIKVHRTGGEVQLMAKP